MQTVKCLELFSRGKRGPPRGKKRIMGPSLGPIKVTIVGRPPRWAAGRRTIAGSICEPPRLSRWVDINLCPAPHNPKTLTSTHSWNIKICNSQDGHWSSQDWLRSWSLADIDRATTDSSLISLAILPKFCVTFCRQYLRHYHYLKTIT